LLNISTVHVECHLEQAYINYDPDSDFSLRMAFRAIGYFCTLQTLTLAFVPD